MSADQLAGAGVVMIAALTPDQFALLLTVALLAVLAGWLFLLRQR
ncbi:MAG: hypothetical protein WKF86_00255 [Acidimicrobiales bacterium]